MTSVSLDAMRSYLSKSIRSINANKLNGMLAEIRFREHLKRLGFGDQVSVGGWIFRSLGQGQFGHHTKVFFPQTIDPKNDYGSGRTFPSPDNGLHTICATFNQIGVHGYFCTPTISIQDDADSIEWSVIRLGHPKKQNYMPLSQSVQNFTTRHKRYNWLQGKSDANQIPELAVPEEFSKEHFRVSFQSQFMAEASDVDGILWGNQNTYPIEIKEKTVATDPKIGQYFGLDVGPFVKLAFYAAKRGNLHSIFVVREIADTTDRELVNWWFITFETMAQFASWIPRGGGRAMTGGQSTTIMIPKNEFKELNKHELSAL